MIGLHDTATLALTKLRTRRIRTTVTVAISGLLFAVLVGALTGFQGVVGSVEEFNKNGLNGRYIVNASSTFAFGSAGFRNPQVIARAKQLRTDLITAKKEAAKKLNVSYDPALEPAATADIGQSGEMINFGSPSAQQALLEYAAQRKQVGLPDLQAVSKSYHPIATFTARSAYAGDGGLTPMPNGQEVFPTASGEVKSNSASIFSNNQMVFMPNQFTTAFMLPNTHWTAKSDTIPVLVPYSIATKLLGMSELPRGASADQKLERIRELNRKAAGATLDVCYRNAASTALISSTVSTAAQIKQHAGDKKYQKPDLVYDLPATDSCGPVVVTRDVRTVAQKKADANQAAFDEQFGVSVPADQRKIKFQIVGLAPDPQYAPSNSAAGILQGLLGSSLSGVIGIPQDMYNQLPSAQYYSKILTPKSNVFLVSNDTYFAEFATAKDARAFIDRESCAPSADGVCPDSKPFMMSAYGSNSIGLQDLQHKFNMGLYVAAGVVVVIAIIIMTGTVGRMLADSRRETAVFRAIGANRWDIVMVHGLYTLLLSLMIAAASLAFGALAAKLGDAYLWKTATVHAKLAFGGADTPQAFHFFGYSPRLWLVAAAALGSGLLGMVFPLLRNLRRNPIKDMREE